MIPRYVIDPDPESNLSILGISGVRSYDDISKLVEHANRDIARLNALSRRCDVENET